MTQEQIKRLKRLNWLEQKLLKIQAMLGQALKLADKDSDEYMDIATMAFYVRAAYGTTVKKTNREARRFKPHAAAHVKVDKPRAKPLRSANRR